MIRAQDLPTTPTHAATIGTNPYAPGHLICVPFVMLKKRSKIVFDPLVESKFWVHPKCRWRLGGAKRPLDSSGLLTPLR